MRSLHLDAQLHQDRTVKDWLCMVLWKKTWVSWAGHANVKRGEYCPEYVDNRASGGIWGLIWSAVVQEG